MPESRAEFTVEIGAMGAECDRTLSDTERAILKKLLLGTGDPLLDDILLASFSGFMVQEVTKDDETPFDADPSWLGTLGASYALDLRRYASLEEWPKDVTPPGYIYGIVESWLEADRSTIGGLSVKEYLSKTGDAVGA